MNHNCYIMCIFTSLFILPNSSEQLLLHWESVYVPYLYIYIGCWTPLLFLLFCCNLLTLGCLLTPCDWLMLRHMTTHRTATYEDRVHRRVLNQNGFQCAYPNQPATHIDWSSVNCDLEMCCCEHSQAEFLNYGHSDYRGYWLAGCIQAVFRSGLVGCSCTGSLQPSSQWSRWTPLGKWPRLTTWPAHVHMWVVWRDC